VQDTSGAPVSGAQIEVKVAMQSMGAMPRMESRGVMREVKAGTYEAKYGLGMTGEWDADLTIRSSQGASAQASYRLSTSLKEVTFAGGTPAVGAGHAHGAAVGGTVPEAGNASAVLIDAARRQTIGVRTAPVGTRELTTTIRAAGRVAYDETRRAEISLKFSGWVRDIRINYVGQPVAAGDVLFTVYSPELLAAQQEYLTALGGGDSDTSGATGAKSPELAAAARQRLVLWDIPTSLIDAIARAGKPMEALPIVAPLSGVVLEKSVVRGSAFMAGQTLYKIAPMHPVWVIASVYPYELPLVRTGMSARIQTPFLAEQSRRGRVAYINPYLELETRTGEVRIEVPNVRGDLRPGMYVDVILESALGKRLAVPESAVLYAGDRRVVFVDLGDGRLAPRDVALGLKAGDYYEVRDGLKEGEIVVTSGNFLVAAESKLKSAAQKW
jgi:Cu(I)/Ag(I) efflux system membrane fusion protein